MDHTHTTWGSCSTSHPVPTSRSAPSSAGYLTDIPKQVHRIDEQFESIWAESGVRPSSPATDYEWCRRLHLDLLGRIPTVSELQTFINDKAEDKRIAIGQSFVVRRFLHEEIARNWTTLWSNLLIGRTGGNANNSMISRAGMQKYLRDSFADNKSYDQLARELITATGSVQPDAETLMVPRISWLTKSTWIMQRRPRRPRAEFSWVSKCNVLSVTTIRLMTGSSRSIGSLKRVLSASTQFSGPTDAESRDWSTRFPR